MTPDQISALTAISALIANVGAWPIGSVLFGIVILPYFMIYFTFRAIERKFRVVTAMYENNVKLVEHYEKMSKEHVDTIRLNTAASAELISYLKNRVPCYQFMERNRQ